MVFILSQFMDAIFLYAFFGIFINIFLILNCLPCCKMFTVQPKLVFYTGAANFYTISFQFLIIHFKEMAYTHPCDGFFFQDPNIYFLWMFKHFYKCSSTHSTTLLNILLCINDLVLVVVIVLLLCIHLFLCTHTHKSCQHTSNINLT